MINRKVLIMALAIPAAVAGASFAAMKAGALVEPAEVPIKVVTLAGKEVGAVSIGHRQVLFSKWGNDEGEVGKSGGSEGALEGAPSFTVDASGDIYLLDKVRARAIKYASTGKKLGETGLPSNKVDEIKVADNGDLFVLETIGEPKIYRIAQGKEAQTIPISKQKANSARFPSITGLFLEGKKASIEFGHDQMIEIVDEAGTAKKTSEQEVTPFRLGRAVRGAQDLSITPEEIASDHVTLLATGNQDRPLYRLKIESERPIDSILDIQSDAAGNQYVLLHTMRPNSSSSASDGASGMVLVSLDPSGNYRGQLDMPYTYSTDVFREIEITENGSVYQLQTSGDGVRITSWPKVER